MRSPVIFRNKNGFLIMEAILALALMTIFIPAALALSWSNQKLRMVAKSRAVSVVDATDMIANGARYQTASSSLLYQNEYGRNTCTIVPQDADAGFTSAQIYIAGINGVGMSLAAHDGFVYETVEPISQTSPDFFIIDDRDVSAPTMVSSLVTGPGLAAVSVSGHYAYVANESTVSQLQIIDIHDRSHPVISSRLKLPLPTGSSTDPLASSIFYNDGYVYLGTQKWDGPELNIIDVSNPGVPAYVGGFKTGSLVNSIYENGGYVYAALPSTNAQMDILDFQNPQSILDISHFAPAGSAVLEGKVFAYDADSAGTASTGTKFETASASGTLYFARAGGGFNNINQYELFSFDLARDPYAQNPRFVRDIPGGVYGIAYANGYVFLATGDANAGFQIWKSDFSKEVYSAVLPTKPVSLTCDHDRLYVALSSPAGFATIIPQ